MLRLVASQVVIERAEAPVMFKRVADEVTAIGRGMQEVEEAVGLRGRKYYGAFNNDGEYRICAQLRDGDDPKALGLEVGSLPGGRYARERLTETSKNLRADRPDVRTAVEASRS